ncbi:MAG: histidinol-phosphate transaminase [Aigarchaeota archaeon]|nr:histidinol-phosphate transaminase [Aigarchaeota archaeon]MDW8092302.1 histidinol-phosphate transaminase [Nitrososphaerota archaeon]
MREVLRRLEPYAFEPSDRELASLVGLRPDQIVRLDTNASPYYPKGVINSVCRSVSKIRLNHYPDTSYASLRHYISCYAGVGPDNVIPTNGADEGIDIVTRAFVEKGDEVLAPHPTYSYFRVSSEIQGAEFIRIDSDDKFRIDIGALISRASERTSLIFLCNPNNPTGQSLPMREVERICSSVEVPVLVDEAYYEYCGTSAAPLIEKYQNLIVVRTLSKAFGLAGIRIGYLLASEETVDLLNKVRPPNSLGVLNIAIAERALRDPQFVKRFVERIAGVREWLYRELASIKSLEVFPSRTNFLLVRLLKGDSQDLWTRLLKRGLVVRRFASDPMLRNCLRITIGEMKHARVIANVITRYIEDAEGEV